MTVKKVFVLLGSDRLAYPLFAFLANEARRFDWRIKIGCMFDLQLAARVATATHIHSFECFTITKDKACEDAIRKSQLVIALVSDTLLLQVADCCIKHGKTLIAPNRLNRQMALKKNAARERNVLIMMDCGFSPGLDHITAGKAIDNIHAKGGTIAGFRTYSGTFSGQPPDRDPLGLGLTDPATELLACGRHNNRHLVNGQLQQIPYDRLLERSLPVNLAGLGEMRLIPEGDALYYRKIYGLVDAETVIKGKLVTEALHRLWKVLVQLGMTDAHSRIDFTGKASFHNLLRALLPWNDSDTIERRLLAYTQAVASDLDALRWLGLFDDGWIEGTGEATPAMVLQYLLERKIRPQAGDQDFLVMRHELDYALRDEAFKLSATLIFKGESPDASAAAKITAYICGSIAKAVLLGTLNISGIHIPTIREVYEPVLSDLEELGIGFHFEENRRQVAEAAVQA